MQFTIVFNDSPHSFSNSKNDSSITLWHSSITEDLRMPFTDLFHLIRENFQRFIAQLRRRFSSEFED